MRVVSRLTAGYCEGLNPLQIMILLFEAGDMIKPSHIILLPATTCEPFKLSKNSLKEGDSSELL